MNLVEPPDESISYPSGMLYLSACLKNQNYTNIGFSEHVCILRKLTEIENKPPNIWSFPKQYFEQKSEENHEKLLEYLDERKPHLLFLGPITTYHLVELVYLIEKIRERYEETFFIAGGPHFGKNISLDRELLDVCQKLDGVVVGEAEETIVEIADLYTLKFVGDEVTSSWMDFLNELGDIPGVLTRSNDFIERDPPNLEDSPLPDFDLLDEYWNSEHVTTQYNYTLSDRRDPVIYTDRGYFQGDADWGYIEDDIRRFTSWRSYLTHLPHGILVGSRGCPFKCSFCSSSGDRRLHPARYIFEIISIMNQRYKIETFAFFESLFTTASPNEQKRVLELCDLLIKSDLNIEYLIEIRADVISDLPDNVLTSMIQSGCVEYNLGLEKGTDRALEKVRKDIGICHHFKAVKKLRRIAKKVGREIIVNGTFIFGGPRETKGDIRDSLFHSWRLHLDGVTCYIMNIFPDTKIYCDALSEGVIEPGLSPYLDVNWFPRFVSEDLPLQYLRKIINLNNDARLMLREFRNGIRELELEYIPREERILSNVSYEMTGDLNQSFCNFIDVALDFASRSDDLLYVNGEINPALQGDVQNVENEIHLVEKKLMERYPDYDPRVGDYQLGSISDLLWRFIRELSKVLDNDHFS
ncbi:MAG: radical SAM protein [Candidatus Bathyarchaeota archaeon]|nr:radical SAM protein [Candidatus Bathyarchaeota archaeon]